MAFAYLIGCFLMDMKPSAVIGKWPISIFFVIFAVSMFFNFAVVNGTMEKLALHLVHACRNVPALIPYAVFLVTALIAAMGVGFFAAVAFMAPISLALAEQLKIDKLSAGFLVNAGACAGANFVTGGNGVIYLGLFDNIGYGDIRTSLCMGIFIAGFIAMLIMTTGFVFIPKMNRNFVRQSAAVDKLEPFEPRQKKNLWLIVIMMAIVLSFPVLKTLTGNSFISTLNSRVDIGLVAIIFVVISLFMKLGDEKQALAKIPWHTIIMICGTGMLISIAVDAGTLKLLSAWISDNIPLYLIPFVVSLVASAMSFFSSTGGVVAPALFPMVPILAGVTGISPQLLFICIIVGAQGSSISPFSSGGSLVLASCSTDEDRNRLFPRMIFFAVPVCVIFATGYNYVLSLFM
jgi:di/tricarboxylate transporter